MTTDLTLSEAFALYGAKLVNRQWAVSAIAEDGALVMSCWAHLFRNADGILRYEDSLSRWGTNTAGSRLFKEHIEDALANSRPVRLVIATAEDTVAVDQGQDASKVKKSFHIKPHMIGHVKSLDGDKFIVDFHRDAESVDNIKGKG
jgi:hypothetical protein